MYAISAETDEYVIHTCKLSNHNLLIRLKDNAVCHLSDSDTNLLVQTIQEDSGTFNILCSSFVFLDIGQEKKV